MEESAFVSRLSPKRRRLKLTFWMLILMAGGSSAQQAPWDDYSVHIQGAETLSPLGTDLFGDTLDLYTGRISFATTDIELKGNSSLPVSLSRRFELREPSLQGTAPFADWTLDTPRISSIQGHEYWGPLTHTVHSWADQRCSGPRQPEPIDLTYFPAEFWYGIIASTPGGGGELLEPSASTPRPTAGGPYLWVTSDFSWFSCLPTIKNGNGEGFHAVTPDGNRYWFDWMAVEQETQLEKYVPWFVAGQPDGVIATSLSRRRHSLYATRIEDPFGNWVNYVYSNGPEEPVRLERIESNDGRRIDVVTDAGGRISAATANDRTWNYSYSAGLGPAGGLQSVLLPDASQWSFDMAQLRTMPPPLMSSDATCSFPLYAPAGSPAQPVTATLRHPSGATAQFQVDYRLHGRTNVPQRCVSTGEGLVGVPEVGTYSDFVRMYWTISLVSKQITGPGLPALSWTYTYNNAYTTADLPALAALAPQPVPVGSWASTLSPTGDPVCVSVDCAGTVSTDVLGPDNRWERYTHGNSHRYNEGKLLKLELGVTPGQPVRTEVYAYEFASSGMSFPTPVGKSLQYQGDGVTNTYPRPLRETTVHQDGNIYVERVNAFDAFARPIDVTKERVP